ncbi:MAG: hydroxyphenylacetyl-CoA thioesterase PaaI [Pseudomonadota bacterium]|nr:hydroxyphenylacetyl-CoA thioesterase PaaI [Pseudomonadota bacterium]
MSDQGGDAAETDAQETARAVAEAMIGKCGFSQLLGMEIVETGPDFAIVGMTLGARHLNGFGIAHGGALFALADTAFAHACNSENIVTVAQQCQVNFLKPGKDGDRLTATAGARTRSGRTGLYDVTIATDEGIVIAEFRGMSRTLSDPVIPPSAEPESNPDQTRP